MDGNGEKDQIIVMLYLADSHVTLILATHSPVLDPEVLYLRIADRTCKLSQASWQATAVGRQVRYCFSLTKQVRITGPRCLPCGDLLAQTSVSLTISGVGRCQTAERE